MRLIITAASARYFHEKPRSPDEKTIDLKCKITLFSIGHFRVALASVSKRVFVRNHSNENEFDLHGNGREGGTHFHMKGFARRLVLKQRQRVTRKWPIVLYTTNAELLKLCQLYVAFPNALLINDERTFNKRLSNSTFYRRTCTEPLSSPELPFPVLQQIRTPARNHSLDEA